MPAPISGAGTEPELRGSAGKFGAGGTSGAGEVGAGGSGTNVAGGGETVAGAAVGGALGKMISGAAVRGTVPMIGPGGGQLEHCRRLEQVLRHPLSARTATVATHNIRFMVIPPWPPPS
jgi:hypothetical protein